MSARAASWVGSLRGAIIHRRPYGLATRGVDRLLVEGFCGTVGDFAAKIDAGGKATYAALGRAKEEGRAKKWLENSVEFWGPMEAVASATDLARVVLADEAKDQVPYIIGGIVIGAGVAIGFVRGEWMVFGAGVSVISLFWLTSRLGKRETPEEFIEYYASDAPKNDPKKK